MKPSETIARGEKETAKSENRLAEEKTAGRGYLRLAISIPAILTLAILAYGVTSLLLIEGQWDALDKAGAGLIAADLLRGHLYAMLILTVCAVAAGLGLAFDILRPIRAVRETARKVAAGELDLRAPRLTSAPELGDLSRSFNSMIEFVNSSIEERNRYLIEGIVTGILTADRVGRVTAINSTGSKILGIEGSEIAGKTVSELRDALPSRLHPFWDYLEESLREERTRMPVEIEFSDAREKKSLLAAMSFLRDTAGHPSGIMVNFRDAAEIRSLNEQLSKTDRLAALGTFTMGLAHELRNPLGSIKGVVQLLKLDSSVPSSSREYLDRIVREVDRLDRFVRELLDLSSPSILPPEPTQLSDVLRAAALAARDSSEGFAEKRIELIEDYADASPVLIEPERLRRAFFNIIRNACEATPAGGKITLRTSARTEGANRYAIAQIQNTGSTIRPEDRPKIFEPFFTTKDKGTGLGLTMAHQIIAQQHGTLDVTVGDNEVAFIAQFKEAQESERDCGNGTAPFDEIRMQREAVGT